MTPDDDDDMIEPCDCGCEDIRPCRYDREPTEEQRAAFAAQFPDELEFLKKLIADPSVMFEPLGELTEERILELANMRNILKPLEP